MDFVYRSVPYMIDKNIVSRLDLNLIKQRIHE